MQNRTNLTAEKRAKEIIANWPQSGFDVEQLLDALLADDRISKSTQGRNGPIIFRSKDVAMTERTALMRAISDATKSPAFTQQEAIRRKAVAALTSTVSFHGINSNIGTSVFEYESSSDLQNTYVKTVFTILESCELTADDYITLLTGPACKDASDRPCIIPVGLAENHDRDNLAAYFDTLTRLIDAGKIDQATYERIHQQYAQHKFTNCMIKAYSRRPLSGQQAPRIDAMMKYLTFMSKVQSKFGFEFSTTLNEDSLGYLRDYIPKESIFEELTKKPLADCNLKELRHRFTNLESARNAKHPLGCILHIRRGWTKVDENSGTLAEVKYAYHRTGKEIFFRELEDLTLSQQLKRCEKALISSTDEYRILSRATHPDQLHDTPEHGETSKRLAEKIQDIRKKLEQDGEQPISPTAPPKTVEPANACHSQIGKDMNELYEIAKNTALPYFKHAFTKFKSISTIHDARFACDLFEGEAAREIILARKPDLTSKFLETLHSIAAVNPDLAVRVSFILGQIRNKPNETIKRNLMHNMFSPTFSRYNHNTLDQLRPLLNLLIFLRGVSPMSAQGVNNLLNIKSGEGAVFAMSVMTSFSIEGILEFINFLSSVCDTRECASDIANMLMTKYNGKNTFEILLKTTKNAEVVLAFLMLIGKIVNEHDLQLRLDNIMPGDINAYGYNIKYDLLNHVKSIAEREDCNILELMFVNRVCHAAIDENQPLGKIMHIQRDITKVSVEKGSLQEFAKLLHETEVRIKNIEKQHLTTRTSIEQAPPAYDEVMQQPPVADACLTDAAEPAQPFCLNTEADTLFKHSYLQLSLNETRNAPVAAAAPANKNPDNPEPSAPPYNIEKAETNAESPSSTLDIVFGMNMQTISSQVLQPQVAEDTSRVVTGNLIDFDALTSEIQTRNQYESQLSNINFFAPAIDEKNSSITTEENPTPVSTETEAEKEKRIAEQLANLPPAPTDGTKRQNNDKEKKDKDQPRVLAYAK